MTQTLNQSSTTPPAGATASAGVARAHPALVALRIVVALAIAAGLVYAALYLHEHRGRAASFTLVTGAALGILLQRSRFCFFCNLRDALEKRDGSAALGLLAALATGAVGYAVVMGMMAPDPSAEWSLDAVDAHIAPVSWVMVAGGAIFGLGMTLSGSCLSAHLYRLGEGSLLAPIALAGAVAGFVLALMAWNPLYLRFVADAPVIWLPQRMGYGLALTLQLAALAVLALPLIYMARPRMPAEGKPGLGRTLRVVFVHRWPTWVGGAGIGMLGTFTFLRTRPLGVTAEMNRLARGAGEWAGLVPGQLRGLDRMRGCILPEQVNVISDNGIFVLALVGASLMAALIAGQFRPRRESWRACAAALVGGVLLGFGAMIAVGCTVGTLLSGIHAAAAAGWVFLAAMVAALAISLPVRRWLLG